MNISAHLKAMLDEANVFIANGAYEKAHRIANTASSFIREHAADYPKEAGWYAACFWLISAGYYFQIDGWEITWRHCRWGLDELETFAFENPPTEYLRLKARLYFGLGLSQAKMNDYSESSWALHSALEFFTQLQKAGDEMGEKGRVRTLLMLALLQLQAESIASKDEALAWLTDAYDYSLAHGNDRQAIIAAYLSSEFYARVNDVEKSSRWQKRLKHFFVSRHMGLAIRLWAKRPPRSLIAPSDFL